MWGILVASPRPLESARPNRRTPLFCAITAATFASQFDRSKRLGKRSEGRRANWRRINAGLGGEPRDFGSRAAESDPDRPLRRDRPHRLDLQDRKRDHAGLFGFGGRSRLVARLPAG